MSGLQQPIFGYKTVPKQELIMERYMYQDDSFERMLKQKTDEYRMYPSDKTWASIQSKLHKPSNRFNWKSVPFFIALIVASIHLTNNDTVQNKPVLFTKDVTVNTSTIAVNTNEKKVSSSPRIVIKKQSVAVTGNTQTVPENEAAMIIPAEKTGTAAVGEPQVNTIETPAVIHSTPETIVIAPQPIAEKVIKDNILESIAHEHIPATYKPEGGFKQTVQQSSLLVAQPAAIAVLETTVENKTDAELNYEVNVPVVIRKKETKQLQVYATPSISYRVLIADNKIRFGNLAVDPENQVTHHMALGWEAGAAMLFPVTKKLKFRTGVQVNYTRYDVEAFKTMPANATVRLNNANVINRPAALANETGLFIKEVANETYQLSIPVGVEFSIVRGKKLQWAVAGNAQPTYLLKASGYLVTNDYKNYIKAPDLLSNMNLNTAVETFFRWDAGSFQLQAGPQFRYQLFSNVRGDYPIREHLVDYGFKIGLIKHLR
jgi:hypothetical protein